MAWPSEVCRLFEYFGRVILGRVTWPSDVGRIRMGFPWITLAESDRDGRVTFGLLLESFGRVNLGRVT